MEQLAELGSPVPDFAATLLTLAEQDANDENVHFLRTRPSATTAPSRLRADWGPMDPNAADTDGLRRMRRALDNVISQYRPMHSEELGGLNQAGNPDSAVQRPSAYDGWAPESSDYDDDSSSSTQTPSSRRHVVFGHDSTWAGSSRRSLREHRHRSMPLQSHPDRSQLRDREVDHQPGIEHPSLRTTALLQSVRRNPHLSSRWRSSVLQSERMDHNGEERERPRLRRGHSINSNTRPDRRSHSEVYSVEELAILQEDQQAIRQEMQQEMQQEMYQEVQRSTAQLRELLALAETPAPGPPDSTRGSRLGEAFWAQAQATAQQALVQRVQAQSQAHAQAQASAQTYRPRRYPENPPVASSSLHEAIKYLERLRFCEDLQDSLSSAKAGGLVQDEVFANSDFILDTLTIGPPLESSWLKVGGIFSGSQHAAGSSSLISHLSASQSTYSQSSQYSRANSSSRSVRSIDPGRSLRTSRTTSPTIPDLEERWPVKVTIHGIDYRNMTLSGTMEAFNVPDKTSPTKESSITTFLEGDIIDFNIHTLATKRWNATLDEDGKHWRQLEPFKNMADEEVVRALTSKKWFEEELSKKWILMRWKGKQYFYPRLCGHANSKNREVFPDAL